MKINFLPLLQRMAYSDYYGCEEVALDPHYNANCGTSYDPEYARIRKGAWVHKDYFANLMTDPTDATLWTAGIDAGKIILLNELTGSYDGGTPKTGTGWGDAKESTLGYDCTATLKDRVYKENYMHYKTLAGTTSWHLAFVTETQVHISGAPVNASSKNAISENVDDTIFWETTVKWFEQFTPAPHTMPAGIF